MRFISKFSGALPGPGRALLATASGVLLAAAFPGLELWYLAWFALIPLFVALHLERTSSTGSFLLGWIFGTSFFFLSVWWLTFAPVTYAGFPLPVAYVLLFIASCAAGLFPAVFGLVYSLFLRKWGPYSVLLAPLVWTAIEFARLWISGNNWNSIAYSQAFNPALIQSASIGGVLLTGFAIVLFNSLIVFLLSTRLPAAEVAESRSGGVLAVLAGFALAAALVVLPPYAVSVSEANSEPAAFVIAVQPNVPMAGLDSEKWQRLRLRQIEASEAAIDKLREKERPDGELIPILVVLPESPMNYQYALDPEFRHFINGFAARESVSVLFNSAEPDRSRESGYFNSAVMIDPAGKKVAQYDKIYLLPFGEFVPLPGFAQELIPPMVGRFSQGREYDVLSVGKARAGVMICFESHFGSLSREFARRGADFIIEMTNDGYLGDTPVLRQHLANAVFRAVETRRPVLRVTNVGITAYIDESGRVIDAAGGYREAIRTWTVFKARPGSSFYVRFGDWFAALCSIVSLALLSFVLVTDRPARSLARRADRESRQADSQSADLLR